MIATGTDIKPLEIVFFMRDVHSRLLFEQMKGRGARVIPDTDLQAVTPDAKSKTHFVIVDAIGLSQDEMSDTQPAGAQEDRCRSRSCWKRSPSAAAIRMCSVPSLPAWLVSTMQLTANRPRACCRRSTGGKPLADITRGIVNALDPDVQVEAARKETGVAEPDEQQIAAAADKLLAEAAKPIATNPGAAAEALRGQEVLRADHRHHQQGPADLCRS